MKPLQRTWIFLLTLFFISLAASDTHAQQPGYKVGLQTWTLRNMNFDQVIEFAVAHKIKYLQLIPNHINPSAPQDEIKRKKAIIEEKGLVAYTYGVAGTSLNKEENRKLFEFAKFMGMKLLVVEPADFKIFDSLEELAKEYDIKVAIHNHGIKSLYGNPLVVRNIIKHRDARIGVCMDAGWITAAGFDAAKVFNEYQGRVFDIHLKDKKVERTQGDDVSFDTKIGEGQANLKGLLQELKKSNWNGVLAIETDGQDFARNPAPFVDGALAFVEAN
ncbi:MAG: sugar phosphate isomerase/epimerase [Verrucomicrobiota bacterium]